MQEEEIMGRRRKIQNMDIPKVGIRLLTQADELTEDENQKQKTVVGAYSLEQGHRVSALSVSLNVVISGCEVQCLRGLHSGYGCRCK